MRALSNLKKLLPRGYPGIHRLRSPASYVLALLVVVVAALLRMWLSGALSSTPFLAFYPALVLAAALGGFGPGLLAVLASWLCVTLFFDSTPGYLGLSNPSELGRLLVFLTGGLGVSFVSELQLRGRERLLKQSREIAELGQLTDSGPFMIRDAQDRILHWSEGCTRLYGFSADQAKGRVSHDLLQTQFPESLDKINETLHRAGRWEGELVHVCSDGSIITTASLWILRQDNSEPVVLEINTDITPLKRTEQALRRSEEQLRVATMATEIGVWAWKHGTRPITVSENWRRLFGVPRETEVTFRTWRDALHPEDRDRAIADLRAIHIGQPEFKTEYRVIHPDGTERWIADRGRALCDSSGNIVEMAGINLDITERKHAEEDLLRASRELERSNKDLESFAYIASHDLQEPLRTITGFLQLLEQKAGSQLEGKEKQYIEYAVDGSKRMHRMITDLLSYSRVSMQPFSPKPINLRETLDQVLALTGKSIEESGAHIVLQELPTVRADPSQMIQVFQNLIGNAIKFRSERPLEIHVRAQREQCFWLLSVQDNGIGLDMKQWDRIFQVFQRLHSRQKYPGSGIGLSICKKIIEKHGGSIWVDSQPLEGCTFYFTLPSD
jgi:PAS domain S-box-containing protein